MSGGGGGSSDTTTYTYQACLVWGLCEGPIQGVGTIWSAKTAYTAPQLGYSVYTGTRPQAPWGVLAGDGIVEEEWTIPVEAPFAVTVNYPGSPFTDQGVTSGTGQPFTVGSAEGQYTVSGGTYTFSSADGGRDVTIQYTSGNQQPPSHALAYPHLAYLAGSTIDLGDSAQLPNHNVEVMGLFSNSVAGSLDADPSLVVNGLLTNRRWGAGNVFRAAWVGDLTSYQSYCLSAGLLVSVAYSQQQSLAQTIGDLATYTNADVATLSGKLTLLPRGDQAISGNGATWSPPAVVATLGDDDWLDVGNATTSSGASLTDPLVPVRTRPSAAVNQVTIEILNRANQYSPEPITARDPAAIAAYGLNAGQTQQAHMFADMRGGRKSAQLLLQRNAARQTWQGTVGAQRQRLDIGDWITINRSTLNLIDRPVRITEIARPQDRTLQLVMEEILTGAGTAAAHTVPTGLADQPAWNATPPDVNAPVLFEPPDVLGGGVALWVAVSGLAPDWGGAQVLASIDNETYTRVGTITAPSVQGALSAPLASISRAASGPTIDQVNTAAVVLDGGALPSTTTAGAVALQTTLCWIDGEVIAYQTAALTGTESYSLTWLVRGAYDTPIGAHPVGAPFVLLSAPLFTYSLRPGQIGQTVYLKLPSFNRFGGEPQDPAEVQAYSHTVTGAALTTSLPDVTGIATAYVAGISQLTWSPVTDFRAVDYEIRQGSDPNSAQMVARTPLTQSPTYGDGMYWLAAHYQVPNGPDVYSATWQGIEITGSQLVANVVASWSEAADGWSGTCAGTAILGGRLTLQSAGDEMQSTDVTSQQNVFAYGGYVPSGTYQIPAARRVVLPRVATCTVAITLGAVLAQSDSVNDILSAPDVTAVVNVTGIDLGTVASASPQIRLSQDGVTWGAWQAWIPGAYTAMGFDARVVLATTDPTVAAVLTDFAVAVDVPDLVQSATNVAVPAAGLTVTFAQPFVGGPAGEGQPPLLQVSIIGAESGDTVVISWRSTTGFAVQVVNGGVGVARTVDYTAQGF